MCVCVCLSVLKETSKRKTLWRNLSPNPTLPLNAPPLDPLSAPLAPHTPESAALVAAGDKAGLDLPGSGPGEGVCVCVCVCVTDGGVRGRGGRGEGGVREWGWVRGAVCVV